MKTKSIGKNIYLLKGLLLSYIITSILILIFSLILTYSGLGESKMPLINTIVMIVSISSGSIYAGKMTKEKGWINGGVVGILYYILLIILNLIVFKSISFNIFSVTNLIISSIVGIIGGIIGINLN